MGVFAEKLKAALQERELQIPVIVQDYKWEEKACCIYPVEVFKNLAHYLQMGWSGVKTQERRAIFKDIVDAYIKGEISLTNYHLGHYLLYGDYLTEEFEGDFKATTLGTKRFNLYRSIPGMKLDDNDDFLIAVWHSMIYTYQSGSERNPVLSNVRIAFKPDFLGHHTGAYYSNCDWVEPISGRSDSNRDHHRLVKDDREIMQDART